MAYPVLLLAGGLIALFFASSQKGEAPPPVNGAANDIFSKLSGIAVNGPGKALSLAEYQTDVNELSPDERTEFDTAVMGCDKAKLAALADKFESQHPATAKTLRRLSSLGCKVNA